MQLKVRVVRNRRSVYANYRLWVCLIIVVILVQILHLARVEEKFCTIRGEYPEDYDKLRVGFTTQQRSNATRQALGGKFQSHDGKLLMVTTLWGPGVRHQIVSDMTDWTFKYSRNCELFSTDLVSMVRLKVSLQCDQSPPSILTSTTDRPDDVFMVAFGSRCLGDFIESCCTDGNPVPNVVHFVWFTDAEMTFFNFISLLSAIRFLKPCLILVHGPFLPRGAYWDYLVQLSPNVVHVRRERPLVVFGNKLEFKEHSSDVMRIEALIQYGGIYMDFDEVLLRPLDSLRRFEYVQGRELPDYMGSQVIISKRNATFLLLWYDSYRNDYNKAWTYNALWVPNKIAETHPELIHVEGFNFTRPSWKNVKQIYDQRHAKRGTRTFSNYLKSVHLDLFIYLVYSCYELRSKLYS